MTDVTETTQAAHDRRAAEHRRLVNTPLPDGWMRLCIDAGFPGLPDCMSMDEAERRIRAIVNVVLPLHEQRVREQVADELRSHAVECHAVAESFRDERSGPLADEGKYFAAAARYILDDTDLPEGNNV